MYYIKHKNGQVFQYQTIRSNVIATDGQMQSWDFRSIDYVAKLPVVLVYSFTSPDDMGAYSGVNVPLGFLQIRKIEMLKLAVEKRFKRGGEYLYISTIEKMVPKIDEKYRDITWKEQPLIPGPTCFEGDPPSDYAQSVKEIIEAWLPY